MSGGSFDYAYSSTIQFAAELRNRLRTQEKEPEWSADTICNLTKIVELANYIGLLMKEVEWLYSGDTGENTFTERVQKIDTRFAQKVVKLSKDRVIE